MVYKFIFVALCFVVATIAGFLARYNQDRVFLALGLFFTVLADFFLVLMDWHMPGVSVFIFVHFCYMLRVLPARHFYKVGIGIAVALVGIGMGQIIVVGGMYGLAFLVNIYVNIKYRTQKKALVLTGLILFMLCDLNVLLYNAQRYLGVGFAWGLSFYLIWVFYLPSQLLLAFSGCNASGSATAAPSPKE